MGLIGEPVPLGTRIGLPTSRNSHRFSRAAVSAAASRSRLSRRFIPRATTANLWTTVRLRPGMLLGTSCAVSPPSSDTSRSFRKGRNDASNPAVPPAGPSFARRAQRPVRTSSASPGPTLTPACFSHASISARYARVAPLATRECVPTRGGGACSARTPSFPPFRIGNEVGCSELVGRAPAAPIRQLGHPALELLFGRAGRVRLLGRLISPGRLAED